MQRAPHCSRDLKPAEKINERKPHPEGDQTAEKQNQPDIHSVPPGDLRPSKIVPTTMPVNAARISPNL